MTEPAYPATARAAQVPAFGPPLTDAAAYHRLARELREHPSGERPLRVALLASYTIGFLEPYLRVELERCGIAGELFVGGFGQLEALVLDPASPLHDFAPDVALLALRVEDMAPEAPLRMRSPDGTEYAEALDAAIARYAALLDAGGASRRWTTLVANFAEPEQPVFGVGDASVQASRAAHAARANARLRDLVAPMGGAFVWDYAGLVRARGGDAWRDDRLWYLGRIPVAASHHAWFAQHLARTIRAATRPMAKVLVLDLDNTLWHGVLGDDGIHGIKVGDDYPGNVHKAVQRQALSLRDRGVLLAIASKNDPELVREAFAVHPELLLRWDDFAAHAVGWGPKSAGIAAMAEALGLGLDAFVFLDDNPVERAEVRAALPQVRVIDVEPWGSLERALAHCPWFDQLATSAEDFERAAQYAREQQRRQLQATHGTMEEYLGSLEMVAAPAVTTALERGRVAQLIAKTNQFNLTLRRPAEAELAAWMEAADDRLVAHMRLADRFGDQGIIAAAVLAREGTAARIDVFVMSCRVMNRQAEAAFLAFLGERARAWGCDTLIGEYVEGPRNRVVAALYPALGFEADDADPARARWRRPVAHGGPDWPAVIRRAGP